jgi:hypothetical protein
MKDKMTMVCVLIALGIAFPLRGGEGSGEKGPKQPLTAAHTERVSFAPGGVIRIDKSYGYLTVEGWDEPEVEITVVKSTDRSYEPGDNERAEQRFDDVRVFTERRSDKELAISTSLPVRKGLFKSVLPSGGVIVTPPLLPVTRRGVTVEYTVHVPRDSRLVIRNDNGYVWVSDVMGDIEVHSHTGDMIVMLGDPGPYAIDAKTGLGSVSSDFAGRSRKKFLVGSRYTHAGEEQSKRIYLRMGRGNITVKGGPPSGYRTDSPRRWL